MNDKKRVVLLAACAVACGALLDRMAVAGENDLTLCPTPQPIYAAAAPVSTPVSDVEGGVLQEKMRQYNVGGRQLDSWGIGLHGYADAGLSINVLDPPSGSNGFGRQFDDRSMDPKLHQIGLILERDALVTRDKFDTGFVVHGIFGADARYTQANGMNIYGDGYANRRAFLFFNDQNGDPSPYILHRRFPGQADPENQFDLLQAYLSMNFPVGNGLLVNAGKFVTPWGIEKIDPTQNGFFSHSWIFSLSAPKTLTGVTGRYQLDPVWGVMGGIVVGWDQALEDNNDFPSLVAQVTYDPANDLHAALSAIVGPEQEDNRSDYRWLFDATVTWQVDSNFSVGAEGVFGFEPDSGTKFTRPNLPNQAPSPKFLRVSNSNATWNGVAGYVSYRYDPEGMYIGNFRAEAFSDGDGARLLATRVYSLTGALSIRPFVDDEVGKNFVIRPEIRYDYSDRELFDGDSHKWQITIGADVMFSF